MDALGDTQTVAHQAILSGILPETDIQSWVAMVTRDYGFYCGIRYSKEHFVFGANHVHRILFDDRAPTTEVNTDHQSSK